ncbi:hypothetical protein OUZ56_013526 [Daphnia magna]|uniref:Secreted protein n=1 Tax=Daphnia magna TaxID=35525 RepID=A0ABQ9Z651_9CRUS|nr:hypothetical protein OUZ56_013526 [Daphnia magna]
MFIILCLLQIGRCLKTLQSNEFTSCFDPSCLSCISENLSHAEFVCWALKDMHDNLVLCKAKCKNIGHSRFSLHCTQNNIQGPPFLPRGYGRKFTLPLLVDTSPVDRRQRYILPRKRLLLFYSPCLFC